jgi:hypothetical protein
MNEIMPLFVFQPVVRHGDKGHLVLRQQRWVGFIFYILIISAVFDLCRWAYAWSSTWPVFMGFPWIALIVLTQCRWWRVRSLTLDRAAGTLKTAYFVGPSRQRPLTDVLAVQLALYRRPWTYCQVRLAFKGQNSFLRAGCGGRRQEVVSALAGRLADFLEVPRNDKDPTAVATTHLSK